MPEAKLVRDHGLLEMEMRQIFPGNARTGQTDQTDQVSALPIGFPFRGSSLLRAAPIDERPHVEASVAEIEIPVKVRLESLPFCLAGNESAWPAFSWECVLSTQPLDRSGIKPQNG